VNCFIQPEAGGKVVDPHDELETGHEELYVVLWGRAEFTLDGEPHDCVAGSCVAVRDPRVLRGAIAVEPGTAVLAIGGTPGKAYEVSRWDAKWTGGLPQG
jgi:quercetin dioxygenase-like cupin family protein